MTMNIYNANGITFDIIELNKLNDYYNKNDDITMKTNDEISTIQNKNKEEPQRFLKKSFALSFTKRALFFKPRMSEWGSVDLNIPIENDEFKEFLQFGDNFKNFIFNHSLALTDKMPECIEMGIDDQTMKHKLKFRESMPEYSYNEEDMNDEQYHRIFNMITVKKTEKYGISPTITIQLQQISFYKDIFNNDFPSYFNGRPNMKKLINENNKYIVSDFKFLTKDGPKEKSYDFMLFLEIRKISYDLEQDLDDETREAQINELEKLIIKFDTEHYTYERLMTYMSKRKRNTMLGLEISPTKLLLSFNKFKKMYTENPLYPINEYIDGNVYYNKIEEYIVGKKETDRDGKVSISKSKKSRYDFYMKLIVFDETDSEQTQQVSERPNYFSRTSEPIKEDKKPEEVDIDVPDSDNEE